MSQVILYKDFDVNSLFIGELTKNKAGGNQVSLKYNDSKKIVMQIPNMVTPFGLSEYTPENGSGPVKYSIDFSFKGYTEDAKLDKCLRKFREIDEKMIDLAVENSQQWFGKKMSKEVVEELYRPLIKESKQPDKYAPTLKIKIRTRADNTMSMDAFDVDRNPFNMSCFQPGTSAKSIVEFAPVWFVNKQFGLTLTMLQMGITSLPQSKLSGFAFQDEDSDIEDPEY